MSTSRFRVEEHIVPCQHIREYPRATSGEQEDELQLVVKQYVPLNNPNPSLGDVTIIGAHANGFPKELYEPLWDDLLVKSKELGFRIRGIWIADVASQGDSGVLNEHLLGNDPGWHDNARDLLNLINIKRDQIKRPIIGIGHSLGGNGLVSLSLMHPRLLTSLILIDPVILAQEGASFDAAFAPAKLSTWRRDLWPSRAEAEKAFRRSPFYQSWDPRVLDRWLQHGFREIPTLIYPETTTTDPDQTPPPTPSPVPGSVTLKTPKHQELFTYLRPNYTAFTTGVPDTLNHPDVTPHAATAAPFTRPECEEIFHRLPSLRPSTLYLFGDTSALSTPELRRAKMEITGTGVGGSGGAKEGRVKEVVFQKVGHLIPMEIPERCAGEIGAWVKAELERWSEGEEAFRRKWGRMEAREKVVIDEKWKDMIGQFGGGIKEDREESGNATGEKGTDGKGAGKASL